MHIIVMSYSTCSHQPCLQLSHMLEQLVLNTRKEELTTESHVGTASVEHKERRDCTHCDISTTIQDDDTYTNTCLSEYDVISSLQLVSVFLLH